MTSALATATFLTSVVAMALVRAPHIKRSTRLKVATHRRSTLDNGLVGLVSLGFILPLVWSVTGLLSFADYAFHALPFGAGVVCLVMGLWVLHRSHRALGTNWSNTLELREIHQLVTQGVYRHVRHPMYVALLLHGLGQALVIPNGVAGPSFLVPFALLVAARVAAEEQMMLEAFGDSYGRYRSHTKRLLPGVW